MLSMRNEIIKTKAFKQTFKVETVFPTVIHVYWHREFEIIKFYFTCNF